MTITNVAATNWWNQKKVAVLSTGDEILVVHDTPTNVKFIKRASNGTQTPLTGDIAGAESGSLVATADNRLFFVWRQSGTGGSRTSNNLYLASGTLSGSTITWGTAQEVGGAGYWTGYFTGAWLNYPDLVAVQEGTGWNIMIVYSYQQSTDNQAYSAKVNLSSGLTYGSWTNVQMFDQAIANPTFPSICLNPANNYAHVTYSGGTTGANYGIRYRMANYGSGTWGAWTSEVAVDTTHYVLSNQGYGVVCQWDAGRSLVVIGGLTYDGTNNRHVVWDSSNFTSFVNRWDAIPDNSGYDTVAGPGMAIDSATGDVYLAGSRYISGIGFADVAYVKLTRVGLALNPSLRTTIDSFLTGSTSVPANTFAWFANGKVRMLYTRGNNSPYQLAYYETAPPTYDSISYGEYVGSFAKQTTAGYQDVSLPAGCPDLRNAKPGTWSIEVVGATYDTSAIATATWKAHYMLMVGATTGPYNSYASTGTSADGQNFSDTSRRFSSKLITLAESGGTNRNAASFVEFPTASTFRINWDSAESGVNVFIFKVTVGLEAARIVQWDFNATGNKSVTGVGFTPDLAEHFMIEGVSLDSVTTTVYLALGKMNKHGQQWGLAVAADDNADTSNTSRRQETDTCLTGVGPGEYASSQAHFVSMDADGFTVYFSVAAYTSRPWTLCKKGLSSKLGTHVLEASPDAVLTRHGFVATGLTVLNVSNGPTSTPQTHAAFNLGMTDFTNHRVIGVIDRDNVGTSEADSIWYNDKSTLSASTGPTAYNVGTYALTDTTTITATFTNAALGTEHLYCLTGPPGTDTYPQTVAT